MLLAASYDVDTATNAEDGVKLAGERRPDVIVMDIGLPGEDGVHMVELTRRIIGNLLDNAARCTPAGCIVTAALAARRGTVELVVTDDRPGNDSAERLQVLDRFRRGSSSTGIAGTGLGLAIVAAAASELGGSLALSDASPHGLQSTVGLRSAPPAAG